MGKFAHFMDYFLVNMTPFGLKDTPFYIYYLLDVILNVQMHTKQTLRLCLYYKQIHNKIFLNKDVTKVD